MSVDDLIFKIETDLTYGEEITIDTAKEVVSELGGNQYLITGETKTNTAIVYMILLLRRQHERD